MPRIDLNDAYHMLFWEECNVQIKTIEREILTLESGVSGDEHIHNIFRMAHSIKGSAATLELEDLKKLAHAMESLFTLIKNREISLDIHVMNVALNAIDLLKHLHQQLIESDDEHLGVPLTIALIEKQIDLSQKSAENNFEIQVVFEPEAEFLSLKAYIVVNALGEAAKEIMVEPEDFEDLEDEDLLDGVVIKLRTTETQERLEEILDGITEIGSIHIEALAERVEKQPKIVEASGPIILETGTVKVNTKRIDQLVDLMGEFSIEKETLNNIVKGMKRQDKKNPEAQRLIHVSEQISRLSDALQEIILSTRMTPLDTLFSRFPRLVRDLSQICDKQVQLTIEGQGICIDREMIERLMDPLTHLIRNALDHGLESEVDRLKALKPLCGTLKLSAKQRHDRVLIEIEDDGKGIDLHQIKNKILERGLLTLEEMEDLEEERLLNYIFDPGFSTAKEVSEISGRGVGLDVVKSNISQLRGQVSLLTVLGKGTTFRIELPLTLAIVNAMLIKDAGIKYALPLVSLNKTFRLKNEEIQNAVFETEKGFQLQWEEEILPARWLKNDLFQESPSELRNKLASQNKLYILIIGTDTDKWALVADEIIGEQEIVIKSLGAYIGSDKILGEVSGITGASILGDGDLAYVLDPYHLYNMFQGDVKI